MKIFSCKNFSLYGICILWHFLLLYKAKEMSCWEWVCNWKWEPFQLLCVDWWELHLEWIWIHLWKGYVCNCIHVATKNLVAAPVNLNMFSWLDSHFTLSSTHTHTHDRHNVKNSYVFWTVTGFIYITTGLLWSRLLAFLGRNLERASVFASSTGVGGSGRSMLSVWRKVKVKQTLKNSKSPS